MKALFGSCAWNLTAAGHCDAGVLAVLYGGALRRFQTLALVLFDRLADRSKLLVLGKGGQPRAVVFPAPAAAAVSAWVCRRGVHEGPLFHPINKAGRNDRDRVLTGHDTVTITARYARRVERAQRTIAETVHVPYVTSHSGERRLTASEAVPTSQR